jgi:sterol 24-C-methyltransferase
MSRGPALNDASAPEVRSYYELLGNLYRAAWGDSIHFSLFRDGESRDEAALATERMLADEGGFGPGMSVLDVGCGSGGPALTIAEHSGARVTGIDLVPRHIELARARAAERGLARQTVFVEGDATSLPFEDASFDHVYAIESAYHATDKARFYAECARVLRPGGCFLGTDWLHGGAADGEVRARQLEAVRRHHAIPSLIGLDAVRAHLEAAGLVPEVVEDLAERGDVQRNWEPLGLDAWPRLAAAVDGGPPEALPAWRAGAQALAEAAGSGAFVIGFWRARRPL